MEIRRSSKLNLQYSTEAKKQQLARLLEEYGRVCNFFIQNFWTHGLVNKSKLLKPIIDLPAGQTWFSFRMRAVAARQALGMIAAVRERWKSQPAKMKMPTHKGEHIQISDSAARLILPKKAKSFDAWLHLSCLGQKLIFDIPVHFHKHFNILHAAAGMPYAFVIKKDQVVCCFKWETGPKKPVKKSMAVDSGIKALATTDSGTTYGTDIEDLIKRANRCKPGSKGHRRARAALRQRMDEVIKEIMRSETPDLIVVECLKNLNYKTKVKRRLTKNMRRVLASWCYRYWLMRIEQSCERNRVSFRSVSPWYTSQTCSQCGHCEKGNRLSQECFKCTKCGYSVHADQNAALNILNRFLTGPYGAGCKSSINVQA